MSKSRNSYSPETPVEEDESRRSMEAYQEQCTDFDVASRAYERWQRRGKPHGSAEEDWFEAERELKSQETGAAP